MRFLSPALKRTAFVALTALSLSVAVPSASAFDDVQKGEIEQIIRDYLLNNPELMIEVQQALEEKQREQAKEQARVALNELSDVVFNSKNQGVIGNAEGDVTVVEFFDYNCGFCQRAMDDMNTLLDDDKNLRFVMKELPILSQGSVEAAQMSTAVYRLFPEQYGEFHSRLLSAEGTKDGERARQVAQEMGMDLAALEAEAAKDDVIDAFREANDLATRLGVTGTPSYVVGDEVVYGALGADVLREKVKNVRTCGKATCS